MAQNKVLSKPWRSGEVVNAAVCKTVMRRFDSGLRLQPFARVTKLVRRSRLKIGGRKACGFESHPGHSIVS